MTNINELLKERPDAKNIIEEWMRSDDYRLREAAMIACKGRSDISLPIIEQGLFDACSFVYWAAAEAAEDRKDITVQFIERWLQSDNSKIREAAIKSCRGRNDIPLLVLKQGLLDGSWFIKDLATQILKSRSDITTEIIEWWSQDEDQYVRGVAVEIAEDQGLITTKAIERWSQDDEPWIRKVAMEVCKGCEDFLFSVIERGLLDCDLKVRMAAVAACKGREGIIPLPLIEKSLSSDDPSVQRLAIEVIKTRCEITVEVIERWMQGNFKTVVEAVKERDDILSIEVLCSWLKSDNCDLRRAAILIGRYRQLLGCKETALLELTRTFSVPKLVYQQTLTGLVTARIPDDAIVVGSLDGICRSNKATIVEVESPLSFGLSIYDETTTYSPGEEIVVDDFDLSDREGSTGFHFFCSEELARHYPY